MTFPQTHVDGEIVNATWINDIESRSAAYVQQQAVGTYRGTYDATANTPTLAAGSGTTGDFYKVTKGGTRDLGAGSTIFNIGDFVEYDGAAWQKYGGLLSGISFGNSFATLLRGAPASQVAATNQWTWMSSFHVPLGANPTISTVTYQVGAVSGGTAKVVLYDSTGHLIGSATTGSNQPAANQQHNINLEAPVTVGPGRYAVGINFSSGTATFIGGIGWGQANGNVLPGTIDWAQFGSVAGPAIITY